MLGLGSIWGYAKYYKIYLCYIYLLCYMLHINMLTQRSSIFAPFTSFHSNEYTSVYLVWQADFICTVQPCVQSYMYWENMYIEIETIFSLLLHFCSTISSNQTCNQSRNHYQRHDGTFPQFNSNVINDLTATHYVK